MRSTYCNRVIRNERGNPVGIWCAVIYPLRRQVYGWLERWNANDEIYKVLKSTRGRIGILDLIEIDRSARGKGYGVDALQKFTEYCKVRKCKYLLLVAAVGGRQKRGFDLLRWYEKQGYKACGTIRNGPHIIMFRPIEKDD